MELSEIIKHIESPEEVLSIDLMEKLVDWLTFFIYELEEDLSTAEFREATVLEKLVESEGSVAAASVKLALTEQHRERKRLKRLLAALKSYRQNVRRKRDRIVPR
jgi:hypothetical protein